MIQEQDKAELIIHGEESTIPTWDSGGADSVQKDKVR
jgi:hypothetical protein